MSAATSTTRIAFASFIGTAIEFYDFYIYGLAVAMVIGPIFFPNSDPAVQALNAFLTFGIAFLARPFGALLFGHFGDRIGRKTTLVASLLVMGISTTLIGVLPSYEMVGWVAPALLCLLRFGQGIGLGGEWGGAALLAAEYAPKGKRGWFGMFPQLGPPVGFLFAVGSFLLLANTLDDAAVPRLGLAHSVPGQCGAGGDRPLCAAEAGRDAGVHSGIEDACTGEVAAGTTLRPPRQTAGVGRIADGGVLRAVLHHYGVQLELRRQQARHRAPRLPRHAVHRGLFMAAATPLAAWAGDRYGRRPVLIVAGSAALLSGFLMEPMLNSGSTLQITAFLSLELFLMGATFAPMGALLPELFPTSVRYTGAGAAYNLGGILGASLAPYIAQQLVQHGGLSWVGGYISVAAAISLVAALLVHETRDRELE